MRPPRVVACTPLSRVGEVAVSIGSDNCYTDELKKVAEEGQAVNDCHCGPDADLSHHHSNKDANNGGLLGVISCLPDGLQGIQESAATQGAFARLHGVRACA